MSLLVNDVPINCINHAAIVYHVPAQIILSVMRQENGRNGDARRNKNGTTDYGVFQINSVWLRKLKMYGYSRRDLQYNPCRNVQAAAWILSQNMSRKMPVWKAVAAYHSIAHVHNLKYAENVRTTFDKLTG